MVGCRCRRGQEEEAEEVGGELRSFGAARGVRTSSIQKTQQLLRQRRKGTMNVELSCLELQLCPRLLLTPSKDSALTCRVATDATSGFAPFRLASVTTLYVIVIRIGIYPIRFLPLL